TAAQHRQILGAFSCNVKAAEHYNEFLPDDTITIGRQNVKYWRQLFGSDTTPAKANLVLKGERKLRAAEPLGTGGKFRFNRVYRAIVVMPDLHAPYHHRDSLDFMRMVRDKFLPDLVINLGDEADKHAMSFHDSD